FRLAPFIILRVPDRMVRRLTSFGPPNRLKLAAGEGRRGRAIMSNRILERGKRRAANDDLPLAHPGRMKRAAGARAVFDKKTIALVYDFDGTLSTADAGIHVPAEDRR